MRWRGPGTFGPRGRWPYFVLAAVGCCLTRAAIAQEPTFTFTKPEPETVDRVVWRSSVQLGLSMKSGNTDSIGGSVAARGSRRTGSTRISAELRGAYARSQVQIAAESNGIPGIGPSEIRTVAQTTSEAWESRLRLDRYFGGLNSIYAAAAAAGDRPAGKTLQAGGQIGYARALALSQTQGFTVELGYDVAHEAFVAAEPTRTSQSARVFLGHQLTPTERVELRSSVDLLANLAAEPGVRARIGPLEHRRALGRVEADVKVNGAATVGLRIRTRYDSAPPPLPPVAGNPFEPGFAPAGERFDTTAELVFLYAFP